jgi:ferredoxin
MSTETSGTSTTAGSSPQDLPTHLVTIFPAEVQVQVRDGETIVDALRRHGLRTRYKCRRGGCGACRATVLTGELSYPKNVCQDVVDGSDAARDQECGKKCLPCRAVPRSDVDLLLDPSDDVIDVLGAVLPRAAGPTPVEGDPHGSYERSNPCPS